MISVLLAIRVRIWAVCAAPNCTASTTEPVPPAPDPPDPRVLSEKLAREHRARERGLRKHARVVAAKLAEGEWTPPQSKPSESPAQREHRDQWRRWETSRLDEIRSRSVPGAK